jgi:hypothetical protein
MRTTCHYSSYQSNQGKRMTVLGSVEGCKVNYMDEVIK